MAAAVPGTPVPGTPGTGPAVGPAPPPPTLPPVLIRQFIAANEGHLLNALTNSGFVQPNRNIQPAIVPRERPEGLEGLIENNTMAMPRDSLTLHDRTNPVSGGYTMTSSVCEVHPTLNAAIQTAYDDSEHITDIPIYFFVLTPRGHASIMILSDGVLYSVGLGLDYKSQEFQQFTSGRLGSGITANAMIYSPDFLVKPNAGKYNSAGIFQLHSYAMIDMGILKRKHMNRIMDVIGRTAKSIKTEYVPSDENGMATRRTGRYYFNGFLIATGGLYSLFSPLTVSDMFSTGHNCVSFATNVFKERVNCSNQYIREIADPSFCRAITPINIRQTIVDYMTRYQSADKSIGSALFTILDSEPKGSYFQQCFGRMCGRSRKNRKGRKGRKSRKGRNTQRRNRRNRR